MLHTQLQDRTKQLHRYLGGSKEQEQFKVVTDLTRCLTAVSNCNRRTCLRSCSRRPTRSGLLGSDRRST